MKLCVESDACAALVAHPDLVQRVVLLLGEGVTRVTSVAKTALVTMCHKEDGLNALFSHSTSTDALQSVMALNDSAKFNVYEVCFFFSKAPVSLLTKFVFFQNTFGNAVSVIRRCHYVCIFEVFREN